MNLIRTSAPALLPVTIDEVKRHARIDEDLTDQDATLAGYIRAAVEFFDGADGYLGRALVSQSWRLTLDRFPAAQCITIPLARLITIDSITYNVDGSPTQETFAASNYSVDAGSIPGRVCLKAGSYWPQTTDDINAVAVNYTAGFGTRAHDVPERIRLAIAMLAAHWYESRIPVIVGATLAQVPFHIRALVDNYRILTF